MPRTRSYGDHPDQVIEVWEGLSDRPLVVVVHGGFWRPAVDRAHARPQAGALAASGASVVLVEYRRLPGDPGATVADLRAAVGLAAAGTPGNGTLVLVGHSAGGHLALWLAATHPPPGLVRTVGLGAVADLGLAEVLDLGSGAVPAFLGAPAATRPELDPARLPPAGCEVVLISAALDEEVPASLATSYAARHPGTNRTELAGTRHMDLIDPGHRAWPQVLAATIC